MLIRLENHLSGEVVESKIPFHKHQGLKRVLSIWVLEGATQKDIKILFVGDKVKDYITSYIQKVINYHTK